MTNATAQLINTLAVRVSQLYGGNVARLVVRRAYMPPPTSLLNSSGLHHEGRAADIGLVAASAATSLPSTAMQQLASLAVTVGFSYVAYTDNTTLHVSIALTQCLREIDLAFLVDGSGSILPADFQKSLGTACAAADSFCRSAPLSLCPPRFFPFFAARLCQLGGWFLRVGHCCHTSGTRSLFGLAGPPRVPCRLS